MRVDDVGINYIRCKCGKIESYSIVKKELCFIGEYHSSKKNTWAMKKIPIWCEIIQCGDFNFVCKFPESRLSEMVKSCIVRKKRQLSDERKEKLKEQLGYARMIKKNKSVLKNL